MRGVIRSVSADEIEAITTLPEWASTIGSTSRDVRREVFADFWKKVLSNGFGSVWVVESEDMICGGIGAIVYNSELTGEKTVLQGFWAAHPDAPFGTGARLFGAMEEWASIIGAKQIMAVRCHGGIKDMDDFLYSRGYHPSEVKFTKKI